MKIPYLYMKIYGKNHCSVCTGGMTYLQSYGKIVAAIGGKKPMIDERWWDYSPTTARHTREFLNSYDMTEFRERIENGDIIKTDLNTPRNGNEEE